MARKIEGTYRFKKQPVRPFSELPRVSSSEDDILRYQAARSQQAYENGFNLDQRATVIASTVAAVEATQFAQSTRFGTRRHTQQRVYDALMAAALEVTGAFDGAYSADGSLKDDAAVVEAEYKKGVSVKPKEANQLRIGEVARAAGVRVTDEEALNTMRNLGFADVFNITEAILQKRFKGLPSLQGVTYGEAHTVLDNLDIVDTNDDFRKDGTLAGLNAEAVRDSRMVPSHLSKDQLKIAHVGLLLGHADWAAGQPYRAKKEGKTDRVKVFGVLQKQRNEYGISLVEPNGEVRELTAQEIKANRSVSYNPFNTTVEATFVKFVKKLTDTGYDGDVMTAARLRTAFEILKDKAQFGKSGDPMPVRRG